MVVAAFTLPTYTWHLYTNSLESVLYRQNSSSFSISILLLATLTLFSVFVTFLCAFFSLYSCRWQRESVKRRVAIRLSYNSFFVRFLTSVQSRGGENVLRRMFLRCTALCRFTHNNTRTNASQKKKAQYSLIYIYIFDTVHRDINYTCTRSNIIISYFSIILCSFVAPFLSQILIFFFFFPRTFSHSRVYNVTAINVRVYILYGGTNFHYKLVFSISFFFFYSF